jgi:hypothetical protein
MDGESLLGPLPMGYEVSFDYNQNSNEVQMFKDNTSGRYLPDDPRLGPVPDEWKTIITEDRLWPSQEVQAWRNKSTGQILDSDPRLLPDALRARGITLETFTII